MRRCSADYGPAPEFEGIEAWINSQPLTMASLRGKVVVLDFWTYSCINCLRTLPHVKAWYDAYREDGLVVVGVHTPEFAFEREPDNVERAVRDHGIDYPVALDPDFGTWQAWDNQYWPAKYFVDRQGRIRYAHFGEGDYEESEEIIRELLAEGGDGSLVSDEIEDETPTGPQTPESYLGYGRIDRFVGSQIAPDREAEYTIPKFVPLHGLAYGGRWTVEEERIVAGEDARLRLRFIGSKVFLVLGTEGGRETVEVTVDGARVGTVQVTAGRPLHAGAHPGREERAHRSTSASRRGRRPTPSRSGRAARCSGGSSSSSRLRSSCSLRKRVSSAARRVAGGDVQLLAEGVAPRLELVHVGLGLLVLRDRGGDLELVGVGGALEVGEIERRPEQRAQPLGERESRLRARRQRDVVRERRPRGSPRGAPPSRQASCRTPTMPVGPS